MCWHPHGDLKTAERTDAAGTDRDTPRPDAAQTHADAQVAPDQTGRGADTPRRGVDASDAGSWCAFGEHPLRIPVVNPQSVAALDSRRDDAVELAFDAVNPKALVVEGDSARPLAEPGNIVIFDVGRPNEVADGEPVVVEVGGRMVLKVRVTVGGTRIYESVAPGVPPVGAMPVGDAGNEYPVVAILRRVARTERKEEDRG